MTREHEERRRRRIAERLRDIRGVQAALKKAARQAVREHARAGRPIAVWRNGGVAWVFQVPTEEDER